MNFINWALWVITWAYYFAATIIVAQYFVGRYVKRKLDRDIAKLNQEQYPLDSVAFFFNWRSYETGHRRIYRSVANGEWTVEYIEQLYRLEYPAADGWKCYLLYDIDHEWPAEVG